jgi:hypothetical protein
VLCVSRFQPDPGRGPEFLACLWQGDVPSDLRLHRWLYIEGDRREMLLLWEGDDAAKAYVERAFGGFGVLRTETVTDATPGLRACFERDLDAFRRWLSERGTAADQIATQLEVRRRGLEARSQEEAVVAARAWAAAQSPG